MSLKCHMETVEKLSARSSQIVVLIGKSISVLFEFIKDQFAQEVDQDLTSV